ncbi:MAG: zinc ribbon domain-containing protein [Thermoguttaceae bacterium]|jgi:Tfp pilus assembly PilM family ATPase|nr:zinc ribbon domain-containing protein [Thermoguttaceae bacterium]
MSTEMLEDSLYDPDVATAKSHSDTMFCTDCHTPNPATRKYCANCGTALWEPCFRCETMCPADGNFCGACGADLRSTAAAQVRRFEAQLTTAEQLRANLEFDDSLEILGNLASHDHPRLIERVRHVEQLIEKINDEQERRQAEAAQAMTEAEELVERYRYQQAALKLEAVPRPLRTEAMETLLERAVANDAEIVRLTAELQRDLESHLDNKVFRKLMRVLELNPDHEQGVQLNKALQGRLFRQAREYLAAFRYTEAAALLEQIPVEAQLPAVKSLCTLAVELAWLWTDLRRAPHVDRTLLEVANRLCKLSPKHAKAAELRDEIQRRMKAIEQAESIPPIVPWAAPRKGDLPVVRQFVDFRRLELTDDCDPAPLVEQRGAFLTAAGLALQGLGCAKIGVNLRATAERGVFDTMRNLLSFRNPAAWGIDVGSHAMKAVQLVIDRKDKLHRPRIATAFHVRYSKDLCRAVNDDQRNELIAEALRELLAEEEESLGQSRVCVGLSSRLVLNRILDLPGVELKKLDDLVHHEAQHHVPMKLDDLTWGYQRINQETQTEPEEPSDAKGKAAKALAKLAKRQPAKKRPRHKVLVLLVKGEDAIRQLTPFREMGMRVDVVQSEAVALYNVLDYELSLKTPDEAEGGGQESPAGKTAQTTSPPAPAFAALDLGGEATSLVVGGPELLFIRHLHSAGEAYTRQLVQEFQLTFEQAERLKHEPHTARSFSTLFRALDPITDEIIEEFTRLSQTCAKEHGGFAPAHRLVTGSGARLHGLVAQLNRRHI